MLLLIMNISYKLGALHRVPFSTLLGKQKSTYSWDPSQNIFPNVTGESGTLPPIEIENRGISKLNKSREDIKNELGFSEA